MERGGGVKSETLLHVHVNSSEHNVGNDPDEVASFGGCEGCYIMILNVVIRMKNFLNIPNVNDI